MQTESTVTATTPVEQEAVVSLALAVIVRLAKRVPDGSAARTALAEAARPLRIAAFPE